MPDHLIASVKHFAGYGAAVGGRDYDSSDISDDLLYNVYLRPYQAGVKAGAATVMTTYMDLNSVPATGNAWLLKDVLREDWKFKGVVVSDWDSVLNLKTHGFAADDKDSAERAANAGVNVEMTSHIYRDNAFLGGAGRYCNGEDDRRPRASDSCNQVRMGLFSNPYVDLVRFKRETLSTELRESARHAAEKMAVLLRNEGSVLPLRRDVQSIAVIGPLADSKLDSMGSWAIYGDRKDTVTVAQGLREKLPKVRVDVTKGVEIERGSSTIFDEQVVPEKPALLTAEAKAK